MDCHQTFNRESSDEHKSMERWEEVRKKARETEAQIQIFKKERDS